MSLSGLTVLNNSVIVAGVQGWTLGELAELAGRALEHGRVRAASGRVTEVPDARLIRWYTTIGLLDRPTIGAGRTARYGPRHLLQLVAVKRLQAQGLALAQVQQRLAGATDDQLRAVAVLPEGLTDQVGKPARTASSAAAMDPARPVAGALVRRVGEPEHSGNFWTARPAVDSGRDTVPRVYGVRLGGLTLLLPVEPAPHDLDEIAVAARPLLDLLAAKGLLDPAEGAQR